MLYWILFLSLFGYNESTQVVTNPSVQLTVPFTAQAPFGNWGEPYQEACEEASLIMVHHFLENSSLSQQQADGEIVDLTSWIASQGLPQDSTLEQLVDVAKQYYGYSTRILEDPTREDLQRELDAGNPVIVPAAGRLLGNPYFSGEGPWYHMLVLVGYTENAFIVHDPGTRRGKNYIYSFDTLMNAIHNWTGTKEDIENGNKVVLLLLKES
jgi:hypothetical protein